jgi:hypothetical protein
MDLLEKSDMEALRKDFWCVTGLHPAFPCRSASAVAELLLSIADSLSNDEFGNNVVVPSRLLIDADLHKLVGALAIDLLEEYESSIAEVILSTKFFEDL